jgi:hypothetical protein
MTPFLKEQGVEAGPEALEQLEELVCRVGAHSGWITSDDLNYGWRTRASCVAFFRGVQREIFRALRSVGGQTFFDPLWLSGNNGTARVVARTIRQERAFDSLPVLADALADAGCCCAALLHHCRAGREHRQGCWVVDWLLDRGKTV